MGPEILGPIFGFLVAGIGAVLLVFLVYRSTRIDSRPFALPTLTASLIAAACLNAGSYQPGITMFLCFFAAASIVFGVHAHAIQMLGSLGRAPTRGVPRDDSSRRPPGWFSHEVQAPRVRFWPAAASDRASAFDPKRTFAVGW